MPGRCLVRKAKAAAPTPSAPGWVDVDFHAPEYEPMRDAVMRAVRLDGGSG